MKENKLNIEIQSPTIPAPKRESNPLSGTSIVIITILAIGAIVFAKKVVERKKLVQKEKQSRYRVAKSRIEKAIQRKQWVTLEEELNTTTKDFPDLISMIKEALNNKPKD